MNHPNNPEVAVPENTKPLYRYDVLVTLESDKPIDHVTDVVAGRIWSIDGMRPTVTATLMGTEGVKKPVPVAHTFLDDAVGALQPYQWRMLESLHEDTSWTKRLDNAMNLVERLIENSDPDQPIKIEISFANGNLNAKLNLE